MAKDSNHIGAPTKYEPEYPDKAYKLCLLGATDQQMADFFEVHVDTIYEWKKIYPQFSESIKRGKDEADAKVAQSLFHRATGYEHADVDIKVVNGEIVKTDLTKHYPPDTTAMIFWLKNRQKDLWRDRTEQDISVKELPKPIMGGSSVHTDDGVQQDSSA